MENFRTRHFLATSFTPKLIKPQDQPFFHLVSFFPHSTHHHHHHRRLLFLWTSRTFEMNEWEWIHNKWNLNEVLNMNRKLSKLSDDSSFKEVLTGKPPMNVQKCFFYPPPSYLKVFLRDFIWSTKNPIGTVLVSLEFFFIFLNFL